MSTVSHANEENYEELVIVWFMNVRRWPVTVL